MTLSVVLITHNEESNLSRTLASVQPLVRDRRGEIIVLDSGSTDRTVEIAKSFGAKVFVEEWKGYAAQKNSAIGKAAGDWILSLDADEEVDADLQQALEKTIESLERLGELTSKSDAHPIMVEDAQTELEACIGVRRAQELGGIWIARKNHFLGRWIKRGGFYPDRKLRFFPRGSARFDETRAVHEDARTNRPTATLKQGNLIHHSYSTLPDYIDHMNRYSSLGAEMLAAKGRTGFTVVQIVVRPWLTFFYNYFLRLGFLDGREGLLLHLYHAVYVSWKYAKAWELGRTPKT